MFLNRNPSSSYMCKNLLFSAPALLKQAGVIYRIPSDVHVREIGRKVTQMLHEHRRYFRNEGLRSKFFCHSLDSNVIV